MLLAAAAARVVRLAQAESCYCARPPPPLVQPAAADDIKQSGKHILDLISVRMGLLQQSNNACMGKFMNTWKKLSFKAITWDSIWS
jgi:hypothetical protein